MYDVPDLPDVLRARSSRQIEFTGDMAGRTAGLRLVLQADHVTYGEDHLEAVCGQIMKAGYPHFRQLVGHNAELLLCCGCEDKELHGAVRVIVSRRLRCMSLALSLTVLAEEVTSDLIDRLESGSKRLVELVTANNTIRRPAEGWNAPVTVKSGVLVDPPTDGSQLLELQDDAFGIDSVDPDIVSLDDPSLMLDTDTHELVYTDDPDAGDKLVRYIGAHDDDTTDPVELPEFVPVSLGRYVS